MPTSDAGRPKKRPRTRSPEPRDRDAPDEDEILRLVAQRESYRQSRKFAESDAIREELRSMGVELYDKEKEWRSKDGRRGSLFTAGPGECYLSDREIVDRIRQREDARSAKDWGIADSLRDELRQAGVEMDDKESKWRTACGRSGTYRGGVVSEPERRSAAKHSTVGHREVERSSGRNGGSGQAIRRLVAERERHRAGMDFEAADDVRRELQQMGVELFDSERIWKSKDGLQGVIITGGHEVDCRMSDYDIQSYVLQREDARGVKDFGRADTIREDLRRNGVELLDGQKIWVTTDGRQGNYRGAVVQMPMVPVMTAIPAYPPRVGVAPTMAVIGAPVGMPSSLVTNNSSPMTFSTASIIALVAGREKARDDRDWSAADAIRNDMRSHGVDVWDKDKVWRANDGRSGKIN